MVIDSNIIIIKIMASNLERKLTKLPASPGVYFFKDKTGQIIYIGKAGNLRNRVRSYFPYFAPPSLRTTEGHGKASQGRHKGAKFSSTAKLKMLSEIVDIEILKTDSEISALITESQLIKKHKPKFNVLMRDGKNYLFVIFTKDEFPKIIPTHQKMQDPRYKIQDYIGPFTEPAAVRETLRLLRGIFPYCTCKQKHNTKCLNAHMGKCLGFCCLKNLPPNVQHSVLDIYKNNIGAIKNILSGKSQLVLRSLKKEIKEKIKEEDFENAGRLKNQIENLESVLSHAHVLEKDHQTAPPIFQDIKPNFKLLGFKKDPHRIEMYDISNFQGQEAVGSMVVFNPDKDGNHKPNKNEYRRFKIKTVTGINDPAMIAEVIKRRLAHPNWPLPQLIIVDGGRTQLNAAIKVLDDKKIRIISLAKKLEEIYLPEKKEPILAGKFGQSTKHLLQAIRDEVHRFAISYHIKLRKKHLLTG
ncbi:MAG: GIY-YIG nuclease family protein [Patescibacteria group bacterium]